MECTPLVTHLTHIAQGPSVTHWFFKAFLSAVKLLTKLILNDRSCSAMNERTHIFMSKLRSVFGAATSLFCSVLLLVANTNFLSTIYRNRYRVLLLFLSSSSHGPLVFLASFSIRTSSPPLCFIYLVSIFLMCFWWNCCQRCFKTAWRWRSGFRLSVKHCIVSIYWTMKA